MFRPLARILLAPYQENGMPVEARQFLASMNETGDVVVARIHFDTNGDVFFDNDYQFTDTERQRLIDTVYDHINLGLAVDWFREN